MAADKLLPWAKPLLVSSTLTQATIYVLRPMITYRAIELDGNAAQIGLIAALYAKVFLKFQTSGPIITRIKIP